MEFHRRLFVPPRRRFIFLRRLRNVLRRLRDGDAWRNDEWGRPITGRALGEQFFFGEGTRPVGSKNFLPVIYANFVLCCFREFRLDSLLRLLIFLFRLLIHFPPCSYFYSPCSYFLVPLLGSPSPTLGSFSPLFLGLSEAFG